MRWLEIDPSAPEPSRVKEAARLLRAGGLVAFPTETVYGLGANALSSEAVLKIFKAKGRPSNNPLIVHVANPAMALQVVSEWPETAKRLAEAFWPGPLTLVLPRRPAVPTAVSAGLPSVGVRMPAHPVALALIREAGIPVAAPSANPYMGVSPTTAAHVEAGLGDVVDLLVDGGPCLVGLESTVLDLTGKVPTVLRPGGLALERLRDVLGDVHLFAGTARQALPSPGLARRHYAPKAHVCLVADAEALREKARQGLAAGLKVGALGFEAAPEGLEGLAYTRMPLEAAPYGALLYAALHACDAESIGRLLIQEPPNDEAWLAVRDRLKRAAEEA